MNLKQRFCKHKWIDTPWYINRAYDSINPPSFLRHDYYYYIQLNADYVCSKCGKIDHHTFMEYGCDSIAEAEKIESNLMEQFGDKIASKCIVQDIIQDTIHKIEPYKTPSFLLKGENNYVE